MCYLTYSLLLSHVASTTEFPFPDEQMETLSKVIQNQCGMTPESELLTTMIWWLVIQDSVVKWVLPKSSRRWGSCSGETLQDFPEEKFKLVLRTRGGRDGVHFSSVFFLLIKSNDQACIMPWVALVPKSIHPPIKNTPACRVSLQPELKHHCKSHWQKSASYSCRSQSYNGIETLPFL